MKNNKLKIMSYLAIVAQLLLGVSYWLKQDFGGSMIIWLTAVVWLIGLRSYGVKKD